MDMVVMDMVVEIVLICIAALFSLVQVLIFWILKSQKDNSREQWIELKEHKAIQIEQGKTLVRIDTRLEGLDELKKRQDHDQKELRELSKIVDQHHSLIEFNTRAIAEIRSTCKVYHPLKGE